MGVYCCVCVDYGINIHRYVFCCRRSGTGLCCRADKDRTATACTAVISTVLDCTAEMSFLISFQIYLCRVGGG